MNFTDKQKAWILLISLVIGVASGNFVITFEGGCKWWVSLIASFGVAGMQVYHALSKSPDDASSKQQNTKQQ